MTTRNLFDRPALLDNQTRLIISAEGKPRRLIRPVRYDLLVNMSLHDRSDSANNSAYFMDRNVDDDVFDETCGDN